MFRRFLSVITISILIASQLVDVANAAKFDENFYAGNAITFYDPRCATETSTGSLTLAGKDNLEKILNFFMRKGLTLAQASGIVGNMMVESGLEPAIIQGGQKAQPGYRPQAGVGFGLVQWTSGGRQQKLVAHIEKMGLDITDLGGQLSFAWSELSDDYASTLRALQATDDPVQAAVIVHDGYEKSADSKAKVISHRGGNATKVHQMYFDKPALAGDTAEDNLRDPDGDTDSHGDSPDVKLLSSEKKLDSDTAEGECIPGNFAGGDLGDTVKAYAWPEFIRAGTSTNSMPGFEGRQIKATDMTDAYAEAVKRAMGEGRYVGGTALKGVDCGGFVTTLIYDSGFDKRYNSNARGGNTIAQEAWLRKNWIPISATDASDRQPGDVAINDSHTYLYVGDVFPSKIASASWDERAPMQGSEGITDSSFRWYRKAVAIEMTGER